MHRKNIKVSSFTLIEMIAAMIISGLVISLLINGYLFFMKEMNISHINDLRENEFALFDMVLQSDFYNALKITGDTSQITLFTKDFNTIRYSFSNKKYILRSVSTNKIDTFKIDYGNIVLKRLLNTKYILILEL